MSTINIYVTNLDNFTDEDYYRCLNYVSKLKYNQISKTKSMYNNKSTLLGQILLNLILVYEYGENNYHLVENKFGKPYFIEKDSPCFSISHSGNLVSCAINKTEIGIDIEAIKQIDFQDIVDLFFSQNESLLIKQGMSELETFYKLWTLKESYYKYLGTGLSKGLNLISFEKIKNKKIIYKIKKNETNKLCFFLQKYEDYIIAACTLERIEKVKIILLDMDEIVQRFLSLEHYIK